VIVQLVTIELHIREPAGNIQAEGVMLAALPAVIPLAVTAVKVTRREIDDVGEVAWARRADAAGERSSANIIEDDDALFTRLDRKPVQREGEGLALVRPGTRAAANDGSGCDMGCH
jgi:hypothetical protein